MSRVCIIILVLLSLTGCAGKKLMKDCHAVGEISSGHILSECENL